MSGKHYMKKCNVCGYKGGKVNHSCKLILLKHVNDLGVTISLPKGYTFTVFTTPDSKVDHEFLVEGTILKEGSVIKVTGTVSVQQAS